MQLVWYMLEVLNNKTFRMVQEMLIFWNIKIKTLDRYCHFLKMRGKGFGSVVEHLPSKSATTALNKVSWSTSCFYKNNSNWSLKISEHYKLSIRHIWFLTVWQLITKYKQVFTISFYTSSPPAAKHTSITGSVRFWSCSKQVWAMFTLIVQSFLGTARKDKGETCWLHLAKSVS